MKGFTNLSQNFAVITCPIMAFGRARAKFAACSRLNTLLSLTAFGWLVILIISAASATSITQKRFFLFAQQALPCSNYIRPGKTLSWVLLQKNNQVISQGIFQNIQVQNNGNWSAEQINSAQNNTIQPVSGNFNGSNFTLVHPQSRETWIGSCSAIGINGTINNDSERRFRIF
ncbi:MAG: hypothetical protein N3E45_05410 [Oscillatoriaceae bacterium SKW80]|nr:hypothetical protein [Oscillatoriaceae bacterium SKYG93]MCX8120253.1 hypothetical protein [Oscillatoriaceae bacterium SKW80]MDW8453179.1 hypothetical protein [Oscillatoriaceae cyanobacterium SKYGB_i_bin93]HIK28909.1 hypothetical protein [Oscillatoriaceae cyanobacterium M7585_C2015_266]